MVNWDGFNIPENRKDVTDAGNARWVLRNLAIQNFKHPRFDDVIDKVVSHLRSIGEEPGFVLGLRKQELTVDDVVDAEIEHHQLGEDE